MLDSHNKFHCLPPFLRHRFSARSAGGRSGRVWLKLPADKCARRNGPLSGVRFVSAPKSLWWSKIPRKPV